MPWGICRPAPPSTAIGFKKGDRVVFVGPTFVERTARFGHLETALTLAMPEKELIFRNLGWSADTVIGESRGYEKPQSGYANLLRSIRDTKPTLLFLDSCSTTPRFIKYKQTNTNCRSQFLCDWQENTTQHQQTYTNCRSQFLCDWQENTTQTNK